MARLPDGSEVWAIPPRPTLEERKMEIVHVTQQTRPECRVDKATMKCVFENACSMLSEHWRTKIVPHRMTPILTSAAPILAVGSALHAAFAIEGMDDDVIFTILPDCVESDPFYKGNRFFYTKEREDLIVADVQISYRTKPRNVTHSTINDGWE